VDVLKPIRFNEGDDIIREGEEGNEFYIIETGNAVAKKVMQVG